jgi:hypothetical protein
MANSPVATVLLRRQGCGFLERRNTPKLGEALFIRVTLLLWHFGNAWGVVDSGRSASITPAIEVLVNCPGRKVCTAEKCTA